nr:MAG TPA: hypothetical protein [Caudoviricetes sp.]
MIGTSPKMPLESPEWLSKALKLIPSRLPFGF